MITVLQLLKVETATLVSTCQKIRVLAALTSGEQLVFQALLGPKR